MSERIVMQAEQAFVDTHEQDSHLPDRIERVENTLELLMGDLKPGHNGQATPPSDSPETLASLHRRLDRLESLLSLALGVDVPAEATAPAAEAERPRYTVYLDDPNGLCTACAG